MHLCKSVEVVSTTVFRCALQLMKDNPGEFLRRVSIVCLEDAVLHPDMPLLVWLMCAHAKGYTLGIAAASACLRVVYQLALMPVRDCYPAKPAASSTGRSILTSRLKAALPESAKAKTVIACISPMLESVAMYITRMAIRILQSPPHT